MDTNQSSVPLVSIGLAVRNGALYLAQALDSILAQTFGDFEVIVSDNASTDATEDICRRYAQQDRRIRYSRNPRNIGGANNENLTVQLARGKYFRWAAHDDMLAPELLAECVHVLEQNPDIVLCYSYIVAIDQLGREINVTTHTRGTSPTPHQRLRELMYRDHACEMIYGLIRTDVLRTTRLQQNYTDSDRTLLCELALRGRFCELPAPLFYKRYHPANVYLDWRERMAWFNPNIGDTITFPNWLQFVDMVRTVAHVELPSGEKALCYAATARWSVRQSARMIKEAVINAYYALHSKGWRTKKHAQVHNWE